ncbi:hypothetical protein [Saccharopolyspora pogona]|uniref:hypothetical protein n=1 Tax=Saccharopolyspora pogona TaxID=333966 RepID=UPI001683B6BB|nr:hypothetical protein [Saccharopolyspora pogona]
MADPQRDAVRATLGEPPNSEWAALEQVAESAAVRSLPENDTAAGAEIIDLFSRRRSTG